jgi:hypothetical protein
VSSLWSAASIGSVLSFASVGSVRSALTVLTVTGAGPRTTWAALAGMLALRGRSASDGPVAQATASLMNRPAPAARA